jgi:TonB family protein
MKITLVLCTLLCAALTAQAASTSSVQNVRFAQEISPTDLVTAPKVLSHPAALYTDEASRLHIQGVVIVQAYFDEDGNVTALKVVKGLGYGLDENALAALKTWRFSPALRNGLPVSAVAEIEVPFFDVKHMEITADTEVMVNGVIHFTGNVEVRVTRNDGRVDVLKGNEVTFRQDQMQADGLDLAIRKAQ